MEGHHYYTAADMQKALDAAAGKGTVSLVADVSLTEGVKVEHYNSDVNITLDLNDHTISGPSTTGGNLLSISTFGTVIIRDTSDAKNGKIECTKPGDYDVCMSADTLTIEAGGTFAGTDSQEEVPTKGYALGVGPDATLNISTGNKVRSVLDRTLLLMEVLGRLCAKRRLCLYRFPLFCVSRANISNWRFGS